MPGAVVWFADDQPADREFYKGFCQLHGADWQVETFPSAEKVLEAIKLQVPDLVMTDVDFGPGMNGLALTRALKAEYPQVRVIVASASESALIDWEAEEAGADEFLSKPFRLDRLKATIQRLLESQTTKQERKD